MAIGSNSFLGQDCQIYIVKKGDTGSIMHGGRIFNFSETGFDRDYEVTKTFGGYTTDRKSLATGVVTFDVVLDISATDSDELFDSFLGSFETLAANINRFSLDENKNLFKVKMNFAHFNDSYSQNEENINTNNQLIKHLYYNCYGVRFDKKSSPSEALTGTFTFNLAPFNSIGSSNRIIDTKDGGVTMATFNSHESSYDTTMGY